MLLIGQIGMVVAGANFFNFSLSMWINIRQIESIPDSKIGRFGSYFGTFKCANLKGT